MRRPIRLALLALTALALAPGTFVRTTPPPLDLTSPVVFKRLRTGSLEVGPLTLDSAWELTSKHAYFGGWSAMIDRGDNTFLLASDAGRLMVLPRPDQSARQPRLMSLVDEESLDKRRSDAESLARDDNGTVWLGLEQANAIVRLGPDMREERRVRPPAMREWETNSGAESMVRLADGRFIVVAEGQNSGGKQEGLLFAADPTLGRTPVRFTFRGIDGYRPSDAALLPDGRILFVLRRIVFEWPPRFGVRLVVADPKDIRAGGVLQSALLADIAPPIPTDNFEGATVTVEPNGDWAVWLISDDNFFRLQRTLLLKFDWPQKPKSNENDKKRPD